MYTAEAFQKESNDFLSKENYGFAPVIIIRNKDGSEMELKEGFKVYACAFKKVNDGDFKREY